MPTPVCTARPLQSRTAFTLIELLVAMFLLAILAGLGVYVVMNINNDAGAPRGAVMLQQTLMIAKQSALRNQRNTGVRLTLTTVPDPSNPASTITVAMDLQYIQQPNDWSAQLNTANYPANTTTGAPFRAIQSSVLTPGSQPNTTLDLIDLVPGASFTNFASISPGDYLVINDGLPHLILNNLVTNPPPPLGAGTRLQLASPLPTLLQPTSNYRVLRAAQTTGEEAVHLPLNVAIDVTTNITNPTNMNPNAWVKQPLPGQNGTTAIDILFSPSGAVVGNNVPAVDALYLWVRDYTFPLFQGDNTIVAVYTRTGLAAAHPVNQTNGADPYSFTKDGSASGN